MFESTFDILTLGIDDIFLLDKTEVFIFHTLTSMYCCIQETMDRHLFQSMYFRMESMFHQALQSSYSMYLNPEHQWDQQD